MLSKEAFKLGVNSDKERFNSLFQIAEELDRKLSVIIPKLAKTKEALYLCHEHAKLNLGYTSRRNNVYLACEEALKND